MQGDAARVYLRIQRANALNQIHVAADVTSVHRAKRHQSALRLAQGEDALPARVTADYCRNDRLRSILCLGTLTRRLQRRLRTSCVALGHGCVICSLRD